MRVVTRRTGLSADLLRAWERRYAVVRPARSGDGHRRYSDDDIERLRLLYQATAAGRTIGQVAGLPRTALIALVRQDASAEPAVLAARAVGRAAGSRGASRSATDDLDACVRAIERLDATALAATLRRAAVALHAVEFLDAVVVPLLRHVGTGSRLGTVPPVHGHVARTVLRRSLDSAIADATSPAATTGVVVATPVGAVHEFGALLAALCAALEGWRVTYLGTDLPAEHIAKAAALTRARAVALSVDSPATDPALGDELRRLRRALPRRVALVVGGTASAAYGAALDEIGAIRPADLAGLRSHLRILRRARRR